MPISISINSPNCAAVAEHLQRMVPDYIKPAQMAVVDAVSQDIVQAMQEEGAKPSGPIQWDSEKQRRAFFASDGFGGGIPHKRTGLYVAGWQVSYAENSAKVFNDDPATPFVGGNAFGLVKSGIHVGRWKNFGAVVASNLQRLPALQNRALQNAIQEFLSEKG